MYEPVNVVEVMLWGETAGALAFDANVGFYSFEYTDDFIRKAIEIAPINMPLAAARAPFLFPQLPPDTFQRLPSLLSDALPDRFGNALIDAFLARQGVAKSSITPLDRLAYMGKRAMGALEFRPVRGPKNNAAPTALVMHDLVEEARRAVRGDASSERGAAESLRHIVDVGTSAGGARAKAVVAWNPLTRELRAGQFDVPDGFEHWLLKFDGMGLDSELGDSQFYGRIEYAYHLMAGSAGIDMMPCDLLEENGRAHFMTQRFDRIGNQKLHVQTLCAMSHLDFNQRATHDYSQLLSTANALGLDATTRQEIFRRIVFNVMAANCDDHTKNHSFVMNKQGEWRLSPAYDLTHAYNPNGQWTYQHLMSVNGKFRDINKADLVALADRFAVPDFNGTINQVRNAMGDWPTLAQQADIPADVAKSVQRDFVKI